MLELVLFLKARLAVEAQLYLQWELRVVTDLAICECIANVDILALSQPLTYCG
jgi:hypothetical protein